jgi:hypothetical protein
MSITNPSPYRNAVMIGGPADGMLYSLDARKRIFSVVDPVTRQDVNYSIGSLFDTFGVFYVGVQNHNVDPILMLLAGYRRPITDDSDLREAANTVTCLGGPADAMRIAMAHTQETVDPPLRRASDGPVPTYHIVRLVAKDQTHHRVAVVDPRNSSPIAMLMEGYRKTREQDEPYGLESCTFCGMRIADPCTEIPADYCEKALAARRGK